MKSNTVAASLLSGVLAAAIVAPAFAQDYPPPPPPPNYPQGAYPQNGYPPNAYPQSGYPQQQSQTYADPAMNPPPGYTARDAQRDESPQMREQDRAYAAQAEAWAQANCQRAEANRTTGGAIIGGILGAVIGSNLAHGGGRTGGAIIGGVGGAALGGSIAHNSEGACPTGYAMRPGAPPYPVPVVYEAPGWYNPWLWYDGRWVYRPYPYHRYWHEHYHR